MACDSDSRRETAALLFSGASSFEVSAYRRSDPVTVVLLDLKTRKTTSVYQDSGYVGLNLGYVEGASNLLLVYGEEKPTPPKGQGQRRRVPPSRRIWVLDGVKLDVLQVLDIAQGIKLPAVPWVNCQFLSSYDRVHAVFWNHESMKEENGTVVSFPLKVT